MLWVAEEQAYGGQILIIKAPDYDSAKEFAYEYGLRPRWQITISKLNLDADDGVLESYHTG